MVVHLTIAVAPALEIDLSWRSGGMERLYPQETHTHSDGNADLLLQLHLKSPNQLPWQHGQEDIHQRGVS